MHLDSLAYGQLGIGPLSSTVVTTSCQLNAAGVAVHAILSVSNSVFAFETDPSHQENREIDPQLINKGCHNDTFNVAMLGKIFIYL
nr:hypothetical transcript [Hymenolepis microstoma]